MSARKSLVAAAGGAAVAPSARAQAAKTRGRRTLRMMGLDRETVRRTPQYSNMKAMSNLESSRLFRAACALAAFSAFSAVPAQDYPSRPVRVVVPSAPGGGFDLVGRVLAQKLGEQTGRVFVVENRAGAGTLAGTQIVARAAPDGYNLVVGGLSNIALNKGLYTQPGDTL